MSEYSHFEDLFQIVAAPKADATVLLDLNNGDPFRVGKDGWSSPPPNLRRSASTSNLYDGSGDAISVYDDREVSLTLHVLSDTQDECLEAIVALGRQLDRDGVWLLRRPAGATENSYFRLKRSEFTDVLEYNGQGDGFRTVSLTMPAEPFAFGDLETDEVVVQNNPVVGANRQGWVMPAIKGDVSAPLALSMSPASEPGDAVITSAASSPIILASPASGGGTGWTRTTVVDGEEDSMPAFAGGTAAKFTRTSGTAEAELTFEIPTPYQPGDYVAYVRMAVSVADNIRYSFGPVPVLPASTPIFGGDSGWIPLGTVRLGESVDPRFVPEDSAGSVGPWTLTQIVDWWDTSVGDWVIIDSLVLIPVELDNDFLRDGTTLILRDVPPDSGFSIDHRGVVAGAERFNGGAPVVVPGHTNRVGMILNDELTAETTITWSYYPRFLFSRAELT